MTRRRWNLHWMPSVFPTVVVVPASVPTPSSPTADTVTSAVGTLCEGAAFRTSFPSVVISADAVHIVRVVVRSSIKPCIGSAIASNAQSTGSSSSAALPRATTNARGTTMPSSSSEPSSCGSSICQTRPSDQVLLLGSRDRNRQTEGGSSRGPSPDRRRPHSYPPVIDRRGPGPVLGVSMRPCQYVAAGRREPNRRPG